MTTAGEPDSWKVWLTGAEHRGQLLVHDLDDLLAGIEAVEHIAAHRALAHARHEVLDHAEVDVGLEQREAHLAQRSIDVRLGYPAAAGQLAEDAAESFREIVEHGGESSPTLPRMAGTDPLSDPKFPPPDELPTPSLWRNGAFQRVWAAATISIFGSLVTRVALPFVAIVSLNADAIGVSLVRSMDLIAGLAVGLVAGAWVDRLRRRPVLIGADLGRAALLSLIPLAALGGWLSLPLLLAVTLLTALLTTFFDAADNAYLPTIVARRDLVRANGALAASSSVSEFAAFGMAGFLVQILTAPIAILVDAVSFVVSALLLGSIHVREAPPPAKADREPVMHEIAIGLRLVLRNPILRATTLASMSTHAAWGVFGALWFIFAINELGLNAAAIGIIAAVGGLSSLAAALISSRVTRRFGIGPVVVGSLVFAAVGFFFVPLAPSGAPLLAALRADRPAAGHRPRHDGLRHHRYVDCASRSSMTGSSGGSTRPSGSPPSWPSWRRRSAAGFIAVEIGLRNALLLGAVAGVLSVAAIWFSPVRRLRTIDDLAPAI